jgi:pyruvate/oxaloacetate carboxyltransferase
MMPSSHQEFETLIHTLEEENRQLRLEKEKLSETVNWMHDLIWELIRKNRSSGAA